ncbi:hypothetical protein C8Q70DRAFT_46384 [Cubamyces menziesii]|nr:hypothetical protein C8Q70DRAFT_46384 [Cubamyces menziesii]
MHCCPCIIPFLPLACVIRLAHPVLISPLPFNAPAGTERDPLRVLQLRERNRLEIQIDGGGLQVPSASSSIAPCHAASWPETRPSELHQICGNMVGLAAISRRVDLLPKPVGYDICTPLSFLSHLSPFPTSDAQPVESHHHSELGHSAHPQRALRLAMLRGLL